MPRPVHYNCWEAVYFDHDLTELKEIATLAASLGAERFVLDDGWFGNRDDDTAALADWEVDTRKYPHGLDPLIDHIHALGMTFGIWFEPEMINPDSDTYRAHPDWALGPKDQIPGRQQLALDNGGQGVCETAEGLPTVTLGWWQQERHPGIDQAGLAAAVAKDRATIGAVAILALVQLVKKA